MKNKKINNNTDTKNNNKNNNALIILYFQVFCCYVCRLCTFLLFLQGEGGNFPNAQHSHTRILTNIERGRGVSRAKPAAVSYVIVFQDQNASSFVCMFVSVCVLYY